MGCVEPLRSGGVGVEDVVSGDVDSGAAVFARPRSRHEWYAPRRRLARIVALDNEAPRLVEGNPVANSRTKPAEAQLGVLGKLMHDGVIVGGVPAKPIRERFPAKVQQGLMDLAWWDWEHDVLAEALADFRELDAEAFIAKYK